MKARGSLRIHDNVIPVLKQTNNRDIECPLFSSISESIF
jgi:hypothetical protein